MDTEKELSEQESLKLIQQMIYKARGSYHDTGIGPILWGSVITFCSLYSFADIHFGFTWSVDIWLLTIIAIIPQVFISIKEGRQRKVLNYEDSIMSYVWMSFGISIFLLVHININIFLHLAPVLTEYRSTHPGGSNDFSYSNYSTSLFLMLYGIPSIITGGIMRLRPMLYGGMLCWVCCVVSVYTDIKTDLLLTALSATAAWLIPGIILRRRYTAKKKEVNV